MIGVHAASTVGFSAAALSGEGAAVLDGLGFLLLLLEVLRTDNIPDFLERGHRYLRWNFMAVAALINRLLPIIILFGGSGLETRETRDRLDDLGHVESLLSQDVPSLIT